MERFQQLALLVEAQDTCPRLVLAALDAAERILEVVAFLDRPLEIACSRLRSRRTVLSEICFRVLSPGVAVF